LAFAVFAGFMLIAIQFLRFDKHIQRVDTLELKQKKDDESSHTNKFGTLKNDNTYEQVY